MTDSMILAVSELYQMGNSFQEQGNLDEARTAYSRAITLQKEIMSKTEQNENDSNTLASILASMALAGGTDVFPASESFKSSAAIWLDLFEKTKNENYKNKRDTLVSLYLKVARSARVANEHESTDVEKILLAEMDFKQFTLGSVVLGYYDILQNDEDEILIVMPLRLAEPLDEPRFYYDGGEHGVLVKNRQTSVVCDNVNPAVRALLATRKEVLFYEKDEASGYELEYMVPLVRCSGVEKFAARLIRELKK